MGFEVLKIISFSILLNNRTHLQDIIRVRVQSTNMELRNWALKCTATFSLLYSQLANDAYHIFSKQFFSHEFTVIWTTSIEAMFQLIDR